MDSAIDSLKNGIYKPKEFYDDNGIACLRMYNIDKGKIVWENIKRMILTDTEVDEYGLKPGDILVNRVNSRELVGKAAPIFPSLDKSVFESKNFRLRPNYDAFNYILLSFWLNLFGPSYFNRNAQQTVGMASINQKQLRDMPLPIPPRLEQDNIVAKIEELSSKLEVGVAALEKAQAQLKRYRASVLKAACEGRLVPTEAELARKEKRAYEPAEALLERILEERRAAWEGAELAKMVRAGKAPKNNKWMAKYKEPAAPDTSDLPKLPEGWVWATIEQLASPKPRSIQSGPFGSNLRHSEFQKTGILVIGIDNVQDCNFSMGAEHRISQAKFKELAKYKARPLDVLITVMATVGRCAVVPSDLEPAIITKHVYRITCNHNIVLPYYLQYALAGGASVRNQMFGQVRGQTRPGINGGILKKLAIPLPPLNEQKRIVAQIQDSESLIENMLGGIDANLAMANGMRQSILRRAFQGKLVPQDPNDEPASVLLERIKTERAKAAPAKRRPRKTNKRQRSLPL